jgi:hypothetical protein
MGGRGVQELDDLAIDAAGNIALVGSCFGADSSADFGAGVLRDPAAPDWRHGFLVVLDEGGKTRWSWLMATTDPCRMRVAFDPAGDIVLAGSFWRPDLDLGLGPLPLVGDIDIFVAMLDPSGRPMDKRT